MVADRYRLLERHALGGMAALWRARDERTGETVALKRLHPYLITDATARSRLKREAAALRAIDHHAIVRPRELIEDPDDPALVMEFAPGRPLADLLATDGPMAADEAIAIVHTVADALAVAHRAGIVHRDVKPANILIEDSGAVHLVDFGIASLDEPGDNTLTAPRTVIGTLRYTAPERLAGAKASPRSDVWALGAVLYEMLTGDPLRRGSDPATILREAGSSVPAFDLVPRDIAPLLRRATSLDPLDRYSDAGAFRDALGAIDGAADPDAETARITVAPPVVQAVRPLAARLSPVDRAASVFFAAVAVVALVVTAALAINPSGQTSTPSTTPVVVATPTTDDGILTQTPVEPADEDHGRGRGKGKGKDPKD